MIISFFLKYVHGVMFSTNEFSLANTNENPFLEESSKLNKC